MVSDDDDGDYSQKPSRNSRLRKQSGINNFDSSQNDSQICSQTQEPLSENDQKRLAFLCANYFLVSNCKKVPIKRSDVGKIIPKQYSRQFGVIMKTSSIVLQRVFGYKVAELDKKGQLILVNTLDLSSIFGEAMPFPVQPHESAIIKLRTHILIVILMSGGTISESTLNKFVRNFGVDVDSKENHPVLGNVQKLIYQIMARQGYLEVIHNKDCDVPYKEIKWGGRAKLELNKKEIIQFVCKIYGEHIKPEMWIEQWKDAQSDDAESAAASN
ncbi:Non-structural maintenance of chromosomes element 3-like protein [Armadillidium nasatum]|uniref:Non-structural maintenance of chromosomes element 3-like protein n=1 Tax=Armadillidium nasatum TaxID=96803 RepID=A0A5N5SQA0_9CRUS|nr:Non-structural maintenance of chromosomes element 3-like protein [Armadillidium nasatum]